jgi:hypothetical protein
MYRKRPYVYIKHAHITETRGTEVLFLWSDIVLLHV